MAASTLDPDTDPFATPAPKPRLPAHFTRKSPLGAAALIGFMLAMFILPSALNYWLLLVWDGPLWLRVLGSLPLFLLAGQGVHLMGWVAHDGFHFTFHQNRHVSAAVALVFSSMTLVFLEVGMAIDHWSHHRHANTPLDPDLRLLGHYRSFWGRLFSQRNRANLHYFKRALNLALGRPLPAELGHVRLPFSLRTFRVLAWANLLLAAGWATVYLWIETRLPGSIWVCVLAPLVIGGWLSGLRSFTEHAHTGVGDLYNTRSRTHRLFTLLDFGGNYHLEHHLYPSVPQWRLPALHRWLQDQGYYRQLPDPTVIDPGLAVYRYTLGRYAYGRKDGATELAGPQIATPPATHA